MMKKMRIMLVPLLLVLTVISCLAVQRAKVFSPEESALRVLQELNVKDAAYMGSAVLDERDPIEYFHYQSESTGMSLYFDQSDGRLRLAQAEGDYGAESDRALLTDEEHRLWILEQAEIYISTALIGELRVETQSGSVGKPRDYELVEYYDGIPTGTKVFVHCTKNGEIFYVIPVYGSLFEKTAFGGYVLKRGDSLIGETEAIQIAEAEIAVLALETAYTRTDDPVDIVLSASGEKLFFRITLETIHENGWARAYVVDVDAYDGSILEVGFTK